MRLLSIVFAFMISLFGFAPAQAAVDVRVDLSSQTMHVTSSSGESYVWKVSSGRAGYATPRGSYRAQRLARMHYSRKYDNAPMPHSIFFRGGYAIHATNAVSRLGSPASHGCVRLAPAHAAQLYAMVQREGARIAISGSAPSSMTARAPSKTRVAKIAKTRMAKAATARARYARIRAGGHSGGGWSSQPYYLEPALGYAPSQRTPSLRRWLLDPVR